MKARLKEGGREGGREGHAGLPPAGAAAAAAGCFLGGGCRPAKFRTISPTKREDSKGTRWRVLHGTWVRMVRPFFLVGETEGEGEAEEEEPWLGVGH